MDIMVDLQRIQEMLEDAIKKFEEDRNIALNNYMFLKERLEEIYEEGIPMSEEGRLECEVNIALNTYMNTAKRLEKIIDIVSKMFNNQMNNKTKLIVADKLIGDGQNKLTSPVNLKNLLK
jgi:glutaminase